MAAKKRTKKAKPMPAPTTPPMRRTGWRTEKDSATFYGEFIHITVYRSIYASDKWVVSCYDLGMDRQDLPGAENLEDAKRAAVEKVNGRLKTYVDEVTAAWNTR